MAQSNTAPGQSSGTESRPRPWWESEICDHPLPPPIDVPVVAQADASAVPAATEPMDSVVDLTEPEQPLVAPAGLPATAELPDRDSVGRGVTAFGVYLILLIPALAGSVLGFVLSGATVIPALAGFGLMGGAVAAGLVASPRLGMFPIWLPPLAMLTVILTAGQVTLFGTMPTFARELTMVAANLTATAPAQVGAVAIMAVLLFVRRRRRNR